MGGLPLGSAIKRMGMSVGVSREDVLAVLREHPEVIVEALERRPDLLLSLLARVLPLDRVATRDDVRLVVEVLERRFEEINRRFEDVNRRFEDMNRRFEDVNRRFEDMRYYFDRLLEAMERRFEGLVRFVDRRVAAAEKLVYAFNIPILALLVSLAIKLFLA